MNDTKPLIRNISDTAHWVAVFRARETERTDALFRDPFARRLAGERGEQIANSLPYSNRATWSFVARTCLFDEFIAEQVKSGVDMVINLAAGLDARPYRMALPRSLRWIEVDHAEILDYKEEILKAEKPVCVLERVRLDLSDVAARRDFFARAGKMTERALVISEGLLIYLKTEEVSALAEDLRVPASFKHWVVDLVSPGLLEMLKENIGTPLKEAGAPFLFGPEEGPEFFEQHGWRCIEACSMLKRAARFGRLPIALRLFAMLPASDGRQGARPWSGICLLEKK